MISIRPTSFAVSNALQRDAEALITPLDTSDLNAGNRNTSVFDVLYTLQIDIRGLQQ